MTSAVNGVRFTEMEQIIFDALERAKGEIVSVQALHEAMYPPPYDAPQNWRSVVKVLVCRIRDKLDDAAYDRLIVTEWGRGYRMQMIKSEEAA